MLFVGNEPIRKTRGSVGFDLVASERVFIPRLSSVIVNTGTKVAIPFGYFGMVTLRSGHGFKRDLLCHVGIIDSDYRGEIAVKVFNMGDTDQLIEEGERFAQLTILNHPFMYPMRVDSLDDTERGENGFGSTGDK
jgi:dUTP pyrophosphatase